jgi:hypothetical protein
MRYSKTVTSVQLPLSSSVSGVAGITNLGNTCYIATVLQCLMTVPALRDYFIAGEVVSDVSKGIAQANGYMRTQTNTNKRGRQLVVDAALTSRHTTRGNRSGHQFLREILAEPSMLW